MVSPRLSQKGVLPDGLSNGAHVGAAGELEMHAAHTGEVHFQLAVQIEDPGGLDGKDGDLAVGHGGEVAALSRHALNIAGDHALIGENNKVANGGIGADHRLAGDQQLVHKPCAAAIVGCQLE